MLSLLRMSTYQKNRGEGKLYTNGSNIAFGWRADILHNQLWPHVVFTGCPFACICPSKLMACSCTGFGNSA
jgi:hypothetical protein